MSAADRDLQVQIRREVLASVRPARVFDAFSGLGVMWAGAWKLADSYVGCDLDFYVEEPRRRFVGDNRRVMRAVDLQAWNVFDLDAPGSKPPWEQLVILAARRRWGKGERGAVVVTDGAQPPKPNRVPKEGERVVPPRPVKILPGVVDLIGLPMAEKLASKPTEASAELLKAWTARAGVKLVKRLHVETNGARKTRFVGLVFEGI